MPACLRFDGLLVLLVSVTWPDLSAHGVGKTCKNSFSSCNKRRRIVLGIKTVRRGRLLKILHLQRNRFVTLFGVPAYIRTIMPCIGGNANVDYIVAFGANCHDFSIDRYFPGRTDDVQRKDRIRYLIVMARCDVVVFRKIMGIGLANMLRRSYYLCLPKTSRRTNRLPVSFVLSRFDGSGKVSRFRAASARR